MGTIVDLFRSRGNAKEEFTFLVGPHVEVMYRMAWHWTQCREDAEDLVQDVLLKVAPRVAEMRAVDKLRPWLIRILYRRFVDLYRRQAASPVEEDPGPAWPDVVLDFPDHCNFVERLQFHDLLRKAVNELEMPFREVILLHDVEGYALMEVAEILNINLGTVKSRLYRARKALKKSIQLGTFSVAHSC